MLIQICLDATDFVMPEHTIHRYTIHDTSMESCSLTECSPLNRNSQYSRPVRFNEKYRYIDEGVPIRKGYMFQAGVQRRQTRLIKALTKRIVNFEKRALIIHGVTAADCKCWRGVEEVMKSHKISCQIFWAHYLAKDSYLTLTGLRVYKLDDISIILAPNATYHIAAMYSTLLNFNLLQELLIIHMMGELFR